MSACVVALVVMACGEEPNVEEIACDEAVARLTECCDDFPAERIACRVDREGCRRGTHTFTGVDITLHDANTCILHSSCEQIRADGVCEAAVEATRPTSVFVAGRGQKDLGRVSACPELRSE